LLKAFLRVLETPFISTLEGGWAAASLFNRLLTEGTALCGHLTISLLGQQEGRGFPIAVGW
jgi:hypothetical protein